ncbi:MAG: hypothetical protein K9M98_08015 [Cephaloticoccus sp.]|nr:hypothetical protein [Cephaloticoccus sp.]MCF7760433.1 hypothetical protein [Cephaloticoccus sp.]
MGPTAIESHQSIGDQSHRHDHHYGENIFALADLAGLRELAECSTREVEFKRSIATPGGIMNLGG